VIINPYEGQLSWRGVTLQLIADRRLRNQRLTAAGLARPDEVVAWFGAVQAQEFEPALWALGLRLRSTATAAATERAFNEGRLLRTHVMRPTWHFVTPADIRWMQALTAPHVQRAMRPYNRQLELDPSTLSRSMKVVTRALRDSNYLTRRDLGAHLHRAGIEARNQRLAHIMMHAELECVVCSGPRAGKQFTYALLDERAPIAAPVPREEALARLARRFLQSHGPATVRDFVWWSGLRTAEARQGFESIGARRRHLDGLDYWTAGQLASSPSRTHLAHLLPIYDEYVVAYRDRVAVPHGPSAVPRRGAEVIFQHALLMNGQIAGTWRLEGKGSNAQVVPNALRRLTVTERHSLTSATDRYTTFKATGASF